MTDAELIKHLKSPELRCPICRAAAERIEEMTSVVTDPPPGYVRVRVAAHICPDGWWEASGSTDDVPGDPVHLFIDPGDRIYFIVADLPLPTIPEISATVEEIRA